jgi:hypothetical protein
MPGILPTEFPGFYQRPNIGMVFGDRNNAAPANDIGAGITHMAGGQKIVPDEAKDQGRPHLMQFRLAAGGLNNLFMGELNGLKHILLDFFPTIGRGA